MKYYYPVMVQTILLIFIYTTAASQSVGIGTNTPHHSSGLDITSSNKGVLIPRLTTAERNAIASPANGLMIYNASDKEFNFFNGTRWQSVSGLPKGSMILSRNSNDTIILKEGFRQDGYLSHDYVKQVVGDTTIPALNWYKGNRLDENNSRAPNCYEGVTCYVNNKLYVFTNDSIFTYSRFSDSWTAIPVNNIDAGQVSGAADHIAWTGSVFLLWFSEIRKGYKYDPVTDMWTAMNITNAPLHHRYGGSVWTGTEMIIWGGRSSTDNYLNTGARYNPVTDTWTALPIPLSFNGRVDFSIVWTGSKLIIWGGRSTVQKNMTGIDPCNPPVLVNIPYDSVINYNDGRMYTPAFNNWAFMSTVNSPSVRFGAASIWTDYQLVIAGGAFSKPPELYCADCLPGPGFDPCPKVSITDSLLNTGAKFDPENNEWISIPAAPRRFSYGRAIWDTEQFMHIYFQSDTILSFEPSADDWFLDLIPPLIQMSEVAPFFNRWWMQAPSEIVLFRPAACESNNSTVFNFRSTPVTLKEIKSTTMMPGQKFYFYRKE